MVPPVDVWHLAVKYSLGNVEESARISARNVHKRINRVEEKYAQKQRPNDDNPRVNLGEASEGEL